MKKKKTELQSRHRDGVIISVNNVTDTTDTHSVAHELSKQVTLRSNHVLIRLLVKSDK